MKLDLPAKLSSFEHVGIILLDIKPAIRHIGLYRSPGNQCARDFIDDFTSLLEDCNATPHTTIITGDFNIHILEKNNMLLKSLTSSLEVFGLKQHVQQSTHSFGNTLDLFITCTDLTTNINVSDLGVSDHFLVRADIYSYSTGHRLVNNSYLFAASRILLLLTSVVIYSNPTCVTSPSDNSNIFAALIETSIITTLYVHTALRTSTRLPKTEL